MIVQLIEFIIPQLKQYSIWFIRNLCSARKKI